jgi:hypothetical protein
MGGPRECAEPRSLYQVILRKAKVTTPTGVLSFPISCAGFAVDYGGITILVSGRWARVVSHV